MWPRGCGQLGKYKGHFLWTYVMVYKNLQYKKSKIIGNVAKEKTTLKAQCVFSISNITTFEIS